MVDAGYTLRKLSPRQLRAGRTGRGVNPPPQFGHTFSSSSTHAEQNVHSKLQIIAFAAPGGSAVAQFSQIGRSSSRSPPRAERRCPQRDSNPRYSLERAVTWAASRWGPAPECRDGRVHGQSRGRRNDESKSLTVRVLASPATAALRDVLRNPSIRRLELSWTAGTAADWAFLVVLLVFVYDAGGTLAVGILGAVRTVPAIVTAPFATTLVERYRGDRVLTGINVVRCVGAVLTATAIGTDLPIELVYVLAAAVAGVGSLVRPIQTALLPAFAQTPRELVAANVASSTGEGLGTFVGPLLAGVIVAGTGSVAASLVVAVIFAGAAAAVTGVRFESAADARGGGPDRNAAVSHRRRSSGARPLPGGDPRRGRLRRPDLRPRPARHARRGLVDRAPRYG